MCGIVGYVGAKNAKDFVLEGLTRLEYRGYDSAGFACIDQHTDEISYAKEVGEVKNLKASLANFIFDGHIGIGHTRWATHGVVSQANAHPHFNCDKTIALIHNGTFEDYEVIKKQLISAGHRFDSETDTEVMVHLMSSLLKAGALLKNACISLVQTISGAYAALFILKDYPDTMILIRKRPPLVIGYGEDEMFVASDPLAFVGVTKKVLFVPEESICFLTKDGVEIFNFKGEAISATPVTLSLAANAADKQGFDHFMLKEIYEQKKAIIKTASFLHELDRGNIWLPLGLTKEQAREINTIHLIGAGTSWHACRIAQFFFEEVAHIQTRVHLASEFRYMPFFPGEKCIAIFVTQSGETADTLEAMRLVNDLHIPTIALTNVHSSTAVRVAGGALLMQAGPEISVASTKAFSTQLSSFYWLAHRVAVEKGIIAPEAMKKAEENLLIAAEILEALIESYKWQIIDTLAKKYASYQKFIFLGRNIGYPFAMEAALKLKEVSYIFAQCYPAGELKHGPIALIDEHTPVILFSAMDQLMYQKLIVTAQEVKARKGHLIVFAFEGQEELIHLADCVFVVPRITPLLGPLVMTGLMQFFVYQISKELGVNIDKPRNLAKSVTVE